MGQTANLFYPTITGFKNRIKLRDRSALIKLLVAVILGVLFWAGIFTIFYRVLLYFKGIEVLGDILAAKLLAMVFLTFFSILIFSNIITALSAFFVSEELQLILSAPLELSTICMAKCFETMVNSSWMVLLFSMPVFLSYGIAFQQGFGYYAILAASITPFIIICGAVGIGIAISLTLLFPAKRLRDVMILMCIFFGIALYSLFRFLQPEKFVNPESFRTLLDYFASIEAPAAPFLPSQWATDAVSASLLLGKDECAFNLLLLWSTALALLVIVDRFCKRVYFNAWSRSQEAQSSKMTKHRFFKKLLHRMLSGLSPAKRALVIKDFYCFFRDSTQWSQLFILAAIIVIYLYNFSVLPLEKSPFPTIYLQNIIAFLNLGLAGFTLSAVAVRFAFPAISIEGESFWLIRSAPLIIKDFIWSKFWLNFVFLVLLAESLIVCSNYLLRVDGFMMLVSSVTMALMTFGITSLSIGCGATYPRFDVENKAQIPTGFGGLLYMILAILFVGSIVVLEAGPVYMVLMARFRGTALTTLQWLQIILSFAAVLIINILVFYVPMKIGIRRLAAFEKF